MLTAQDIKQAMTTPPPVPLDEATVRRLIALRPEKRLADRVASAAYLDGLAAQEAAKLPSSVRAGRLMLFAEVREAMMAELQANRLSE